MAKQFYYGGQAVIEGVMIRGKKAVVTAVRRPGGDIAVDTKPLSPIYTGWMRRAPLLRGVIILIEAMVLGIRSLMYSANVALEEEKEKFSGRTAWLTISASVAFAVVLFFLIPLFITRLIDPYISSSIIFHIIEGGIRLAIFIAYLVIIGQIPDIKRVFTYHGAEHKAVNAFESGVPMEVSAVNAHGTAHVRCGTSFLFAVLIIAIIVFAFIGRQALWLMVLSRILLIPVIAAMGYEVVHFSAGHSRNLLVKAIIMPGLWLQALTTKQPDDSQLEVALAALKQAVDIDRAEEKPQPEAESGAVSS